MTPLLTLAGRHGPVVLCAGVLLGMLAPSLADAARPLMGLSVFVLTLGAFLKVDRTALRAQFVHPRRFVAMLAWVVLGVPLTTYAVLAFVPLPATAKVGLLLCALGPPVGSAAALAAMLRLNAALALAVTLVAAGSAMLMLPLLVWAYGGVHVDIDAVALASRLVGVVGGAALAAALLRRFAGRAVRDNPDAMTGVSVVGLIVGAIGAMQGFAPRIAHDPADVVAALALAFGFNIGLQLVGAALFARLGATQALTIGLLSGNRNVTLVWVAVQPWLATVRDVDLIFAASVFPIFMLPLAMARLLAACRARVGQRAGCGA